MGEGEEVLFGYLMQVVISGCVLSSYIGAMNHATTGHDGGNIGVGLHFSQWMGWLDSERLVLPSWWFSGKGNIAT